MLYICATPIGNLEDITLRVLRILKEADLIVAEDTRHTRKLLAHYQISKKLVSMHQHNEYSRTGSIIDLLKQEKNIALVSDAGMPGISDPGMALIRTVIDQGLEFTVLPGANAALTAIVHCGIVTGPFYFHGFLPRKKQKLVAELIHLASLESPLVFYEAPHRLLSTLTELEQQLGNRYCAVSRELTKKFEETKRGYLSQIITFFAQNRPRGEFVIVVAGKDIKPEQPPAKEGNFNVKQYLQQQINQGMSKKEAIKQTAKLLRVSKNEVYQQAIDLPVDKQD